MAVPSGAFLFKRVIHGAIAALPMHRTRKRRRNRGAAFTKIVL
jgi:hypothetical protein